MSSEIATSSAEVDNLLGWLRGELVKTQYGKVGLVFTVHEGKIVAIEKTISMRGKFTLDLGNVGD
jgi:hypothetical protein